MLNSSNAPSKLGRGPFQAILSTAKREYRARVWEEKGGKVINNTYSRDNIPKWPVVCSVFVLRRSGLLHFSYWRSWTALQTFDVLLLLGRKFRSWKQCLRYMREDPLTKVSSRDLSSNEDETHPSTTLAECDQVEALPWKDVGSRSSDLSSPGEMASPLQGDGSLVHKPQTLNVISSSSSSEESHGTKSLPPLASTQAIISISSSKDIDKEKDSSSSSSSSSEKSLPPPSSSAYENSAISSSSSSEEFDREDAELHVANDLIHLHPSPYHDSGEKPDTQLVSPELPASKDHRSHHRAVMVRKPLQTPRLSSKGLMEPEEVAVDRRPSPNLPPKTAAGAEFPYHDGGADAVSPTRGAVCASKNLCAAAAIVLNAPVATELAPGSKSESRKRKGCEGGDGEEEEEQEKRESLKPTTERDCEAVAEEPVIGDETRASRVKATEESPQPQSESDSQDDRRSDESGISLKELMWKTFQEAMKRRKILNSSTKKKCRKESNMGTRRDSNCASCHGPTIIVVCPCSTRNK